MSDETATSQEVKEPAPAVTDPSEAKPETDWEKAYKGLQTNYNRLHQTTAELRQRIASVEGTASSVKGDTETLLKQTLGDEGFKTHQQEQRQESERQAALAAAQTAQQFIPQSISVIAETMRLSGVPEAEIQQVFANATQTTSVPEWAAVVKAGTHAAITKAKAQEATSVEAKVKASNSEEIAAEANALAERTLRAQGIDKVDLGKGQSIKDRGFISKVKSIDRSTPEGEAAWQSLRKEAMRGTLKTT